MQKNCIWVNPSSARSPKLSLMMHRAGEERDVSDPWYTRDFESAYRDIYAACEGLLKNYI